MNQILSIGIPLALAFAGLAYFNLEHASRLDAVIMIVGLILIILIMIGMIIPLWGSYPLSSETSDFSFQSINRMVSIFRAASLSLIIYMVVASAIMRVTAFIMHNDTRAFTSWTWTATDAIKPSSNNRD